MNIKLIVLGIILLLIVSMPIMQIIPVYADDGGQQSTQAQSIINPKLKEYMANLKSSDKILVTVSTKKSPLLIFANNSLNLLSLNLHKLNSNLEKAIRSLRGEHHWRLSKIVNSAHNVVDYCVNDLTKYQFYRWEIVFKQDCERIQQVPDTYVFGSYVGENRYIVGTKVKNINVLASLPCVLHISVCQGYDFMFYLGIKLISPNNGSLGVKRENTSFSWEPYKDATTYKFVLAKDAAMTEVIKEIEVANTSYIYDGILNRNTNYFWRVMMLEPNPSDWSATFSFQTGSPPPIFLNTNWFPIRVAVGLTILFVIVIGLIRLISTIVLITWFSMAILHNAA